ncbi:MFS transporter [Jiulongibacter sediminis]|uniref:Major facilitator transporter n=1 Tax=Jiulongibacter sediminis TaxID=1605367 RepID=A0A0P7C4G0_9BACT|nr:MFS transporter [Jiulongibacter sediminis]KPM49549.1 major facilitator transporter [Jiulongibacter sediminis]TBX26590.1 major facilitator transporter [Jiulongibacter sediminis]
MKTALKIRLMLMMFLMFFTWGAWYGQITKYLITELGATGDQAGNAFSTFSIASIISPFFVGLIADRYFSAQRVMGVINILGAVILYFLIQCKDPGVFFWYILAYTITFAPNLALSTSISIKQMNDPEKEFPPIRVFGTIAWIVVTNIVGYYGFGDKVTIFSLAMFTSIALGIYAFTLPDTPPDSSEKVTLGQLIGKDAFVLFKDRSFLIFFIASILICIPLSFYYAFGNLALTDLGMQNVENKMSLGQASEVIFMFLLPLAFRKFGVKWILIIGLLAWILRFMLFGYGTVQMEWMLIIAILLHGICYDFFFVTGQIYTDTKAGEKIKSSAQGLITLATYGVGMGIGSKLSGLVLDHYSTSAGGSISYDWEAVWWVPTIIAILVLALFILFFKDKKGTIAI